MKKVFKYSVMVMAIFALQSCGDKETEKKEEAATLFDYKLPTRKDAFYGDAVKVEEKSEKAGTADRAKAFGF